jgi:hypothetical protein
MPKVKVSLSRTSWQRATVTLDVSEDTTHLECIKLASAAATDMNLWENDDENHSPKVNRFHSRAEVID